MTTRETQEVAALYRGVGKALDMPHQGRKVGDCKHGVYLFWDYDGEPIYVGKTRENLRARIRRHLTNQRTDAVAMSVLDPFEVAEIEMWPFWGLEERSASVEDAEKVLRRAEFTVYINALESSAFRVVLNEVEIPKAELIELPEPVRVELLPESQREQREHPDLRLARRARTIANLARIISERKVSVGIRRTLWAQARRLEILAKRRLEELGGTAR